MLEAIGSVEEAKGKECCCDVCGFDELLPRLHFESKRPTSTDGRKRRIAAYDSTLSQRDCCIVTSTRECTSTRSKRGGSW